MRMRFRVVIVVVGIAVACGCARRPAGVPEGAVQVFFSKSGGWACCRLDSSAQLNRCRTYNSAGERFYRFHREGDEDDVFLRYEGSGPVPRDDLRIDIVHSSPDFIWLQNGIVLLPRNDFENQKRLIDDLMRVRRDMKMK